jgi:magnesium transporter
VITSCFRHADSDVRLDLPLDELRDALLHPGGLLWVDVSGDDRAEGERVLRDVFDFHHLTVDDCYNDLLDPPKVDDYGRYLFVIVRAIRYDAPSLELTTEELDLYIGANYVVSFHKTPIGAVDEVRRRAESRALVLDHGPAFLAHALLDVVVDEFHPVVEALDDQVSDLEERVLDAPERALLQQALQLKRNAQRMRRTIFPQRDVANRFARGEYRLVTGDALMYFRDIYDHTVRVEEMIEGVRDTRGQRPQHLPVVRQQPAERGDEDARHRQRRLPAAHARRQRLRHQLPPDVPVVRLGARLLRHDRVVRCDRSRASLLVPAARLDLDPRLLRPTPAADSPPAPPGSTGDGARR